jgi:3-deoxy-D-manno-octulosonic-acid transferase
MFGPNHHVSHEASLLLQAGAATVFDSSVALEKQWIRWLDQPDEWSKAAESSRRVVSEHSGATERVMERLSIYLSESK